MKKEAIDFLSPIGRLVAGSLYDPQTEDWDGKPLTYADGKPRVNYYFGLAIAKGTEQHWSQTAWGQIIYAAGAKGYPAQLNTPTFSWKITDGDSTTASRNSGRVPRESQGYPGHWVLNYSGSIAPSLYSGVRDPKNLQQLVGQNEINLGDYIQVFGNVVDNAPSKSPGVYLNHKIVALMAYGERITFTPDPNTLGFGGQLPAGASSVPVTSSVGIAAAAPAPATNPPMPPVPASAPIAVQPHTAILTPPAPPPAPVIPAVQPHPTFPGMTAKAVAPYESYVAAGWTEVAMRQDGLLM